MHRSTTTQNAGVEYALMSCHLQNIYTCSESHMRACTQTYLLASTHTNAHAHYKHYFISAKQFSDIYFFGIYLAHEKRAALLLCGERNGNFRTH